MTIGRLLAAGALCVPLLLGGCSEEPEPRIAPSPSSSSSSAVTVDPAPAAWEEKTRAGALAFTQHWMEVFNAAQRSGKVGELRHLSTAGCKSCANFAEMLKDLYGSGGRLKSDGWAIRRASTTPGLPPRKAQVTMQIEQSSQRVIQGSGEVERFPGGDATYSAELVWTRGRWGMDRLVLVQ